MSSNKIGYLEVSLSLLIKGLVLFLRPVISRACEILSKVSETISYSARKSKKIVCVLAIYFTKNKFNISKVTVITKSRCFSFM